MESITQKNMFPTVVTGEVNARSSKWWRVDKTTQEGFRIEKLLSQFSLSQVINEPTHISQNFNSVDLIFINLQNLILTREFILHFILIAMTK